VLTLSVMQAERLTPRAVLRVAVTAEQGT